MLRISPLETFFKTSACFTGQFQNVKRCFVLADIAQKADDIPPRTLFFVVVVALFCSFQF